MTEHATQSAIAALGIDIKAIIFQIINFILLFVILKFVAYKPILTMLNDRRDKISKSLKDAEEIEQQKNNWLKEKKVIRTKALQEANKIINEARKQAKDEADVALTNLKEEQQKVILDSKKRLEREKEKILFNIKNEIVDMSISMARVILSKKITSKKNNQIITEELNEK